MSIYKTELETIESYIEELEDKIENYEGEINTLEEQLEEAERKIEEYEQEQLTQNTK
jgi:predicted  nucleic acid-binding Zn-ribbon protein